MILLIDNYDSFTFNLYQQIVALEYEVKVVRNDHLTVADALGLSPSHIVISPGPKAPKDSGICIDLVKRAAGKIPLLGVCLGHQAIAEAFGGKIVPAKTIVHGKASQIFHGGEGIFAGLENPFAATRYHSLAVSEKNFPPDLKILAHTEDGEIMALRHNQWPIFGVQFHPESVLTIEGQKLIKNFLCR